MYPSSGLLKKAKLKSGAGGPHMKAALFWFASWNWPLFPQEWEIIPWLDFSDHWM